MNDDIIGLLQFKFMLTPIYDVFAKRKHQLFLMYKKLPSLFVANSTLTLARCKRELYKEILPAQKDTTRLICFHLEHLVFPGFDFELHFREEILK